jgi:hypothetical protein
VQAENLTIEEQKPVTYNHSNVVSKLHKVAILLMFLILLFYSRKESDKTEAIPEGFFDDPKLDAKVMYTSLL